MRVSNVRIEKPRPRAGLFVLCELFYANRPRSHYMPDQTEVNPTLTNAAINNLAHVVGSLNQTLIGLAEVLNVVSMRLENLTARLDKQG